MKKSVTQHRNGEGAAHEAADGMTTMTMPNPPHKSGRRGRPFERQRLATSKDANGLSETPFSLRLKKNVDQIIRLGSSVAGVPMQDILNECIETQFQAVVTRHIRSNPDAFQVMEELLKAVRDAESKGS